MMNPQQFICLRYGFSPLDGAISYLLGLLKSRSGELKEACVCPKMMLLLISDNLQEFGSQNGFLFSYK